MKKILIICSLAVVHFIVHLAAFFVWAGNTMSRFDTGRPATASDQVVKAAVSILQFPVVTLTLALPLSLRRWGLFNGLMGHVPFILNSLVWAGCIYLVVRVLIKLQRRERHARSS